MAVVKLKLAAIGKHSTSTTNMNRAGVTVLSDPFDVLRLEGDLDTTELVNSDVDDE